VKAILIVIFPQFGSAQSEGWPGADPAVRRAVVLPTRCKDFNWCLSRGGLRPL